MKIEEKQVSRMNFEAIDRYAAEQMERFDVPSLCYAVVQRGKLIHAKTLGTADRSSGLKADLHTRYPICSLTKSMTALCLGLLADEGKLCFEAPVNHYLPEFQLEDSYAAEHATIRDLLTHMTGLPRHDPLTFKIGKERESLESIAARIGMLPMDREFRSRFEYVNLMYMVCSLIIERVAGKPYGMFLKERLLEPIGMKESSAHTQDMLNAANRAKPYLRLKDGSLLETISFDNDSLSGAGNVNSTIADMAAYMNFLTSGKTEKGDPLISEETRKQIFATHTIDWSGYEYKWPEMPVACYGFGWTIQPYRGNLCFCHGGSLYGFTSYMSFLPYEQTGVVLMSNLEQSFLTYSTAHHIFDAVLGLSFIDWEERYLKNQQSMDEAYAAHNAKLLQADGRTEDEMSTEPSLFNGEYEHEGYGRLSVCQEQKRLHIRYGGWDYPLKHSYGNTYLLDIGRPGRPLFTRAEFCLDEESHATVRVWFELNLEKPIEFVRG